MDRATREASTLAELLDDRRWPLDAFALVVGIDQGTASRIRAGKARPRATTVIRMAQGFGISVTRMRQILDATWRAAHEPELEEMVR
jgi:transcriptional regulator with XRE-family HTH domain